MTVVVSAALLLLTAAVVLLYAMMGELAARLPADDGDGDAGHATPLEDYRSGTYVADWPERFATLADHPRPVLLVLSPICGSCKQVATELSTIPVDGLGIPLGIVVSSGSAETAEEFVAQHRLGHLPHLIDEGGTWVRDTFGVNISPSALLFEKGVLTNAYTFSTINALRDEIAHRYQKEEANHGT
jgi:hypothetical protein